MISERSGKVFEIFMAQRDVLDGTVDNISIRRAFGLGRHQSHRRGLCKAFWDEEICMRLAYYCGREESQCCYLGRNHSIVYRRSRMLIISLLDI